MTVFIGSEAIKELFAGGVQRAVQLEEFLDDIALGDAVPARRGVRDFLDDLGLQQQVYVITHRLPSDAGVIGEFRLIELPTRREGEDGVKEDGDTLVFEEMKDAGRILKAGLLCILLRRRVPWR
jgi:hypothetical protein